MKKVLLLVALAIMGITPIISPVRALSSNIWDWAAMLLLTFLLFPFMKRGMKISRTEGAFLLLLFTAYMIWLVYSAK